MARKPIQAPKRPQPTDAELEQLMLQNPENRRFLQQFAGSEAQVQQAEQAMMQPQPQPTALEGGGQPRQLTIEQISALASQSQGEYQPPPEPDPQYNHRMFSHMGRILSQLFGIDRGPWEVGGTNPGAKSAPGAQASARTLENPPQQFSRADPGQIEQQSRLGEVWGKGLTPEQIQMLALSEEGPRL